MKHILFIIMLLFASVGAFAQGTILVEERPAEQQRIHLDGKAEAVFVAPNDDYIIGSTGDRVDIVPSKAKKIDRNRYEYVVVVDLSQAGATRDRNFTVSKARYMQSATVKKNSMQPNTRYYFYITEQRTLVLNNITRSTDAFLENGKACVEIRTLVPDLKVEYHEGLPCTDSSWKSDADFYITRLVVDMVAYKKMQDQVSAAAQAYYDFDKKIKKKGEQKQTVSDQEWDDLDRLQKVSDSLGEMLDAISTVVVGAEGSNQLAVSVSDLSVKQKRVYEILVPSNEEQLKVRSMVLVNYAFATNPQQSMGLTYAYVKKVGFYVSLLSNGSLRFGYDQSTINGTVGGATPFYTGESVKTRLSLSTGALYRLNRHAYAYAGVGYGIRSLYWIGHDDRTFLVSNKSHSGLALEAGGIFALTDHLMFMVGFDCLDLFKYTEIKVGLGWRF